ncbi:hypothetical protein A5819_003828, partial [Enterococcus sp. 7E2_DIV0204]|uniref:hypothetical protein n=1 Tax=Enterococcus sp. 7E2_DIV0204 TaxID=1834188 RepID=UPI000B67A685
MNIVIVASHQMCIRDRLISIAFFEILDCFYPINSVLKTHMVTFYEKFNMHFFLGISFLLILLLLIRLFLTNKFEPNDIGKMLDNIEEEFQKVEENSEKLEYDKALIKIDDIRESQKDISNAINENKMYFSNQKVVSEFLVSLISLTIMFTVILYYKQKTKIDLNITL